MGNLTKNKQTTMTREQQKIALLFDDFSNNEDLLKWMYCNDNLELFCSLVNEKGSEETQKEFVAKFGRELSKRHQSQVSLFMDNPGELEKLKVPTEEYCKSNNTLCSMFKGVYELDVESLSNLAIATLNKNKSKVSQLDLKNDFLH